MISKNTIYIIGAGPAGLTAAIVLRRSVMPLNIRVVGWSWVLFLTVSNLLCVIYGLPRLLPLVKEGKK